MKRILLVLAFLSVNAVAQEGQWFCEQDAAKRTDNGFWVCGIGESMMEGDARSRAQSDALRAFHQLCEESSDCISAKTSVVPERTSCRQDKTGVWKCYRLIIIYLGEAPEKE